LRALHSNSSLSVACGVTRLRASTVPALAKHATLSSWTPTNVPYMTLKLPIIVRCHLLLKLDAISSKMNRNKPSQWRRDATFIWLKNCSCWVDRTSQDMKICMISKRKELTRLHKKLTPWLYSSNELYRQSDRRLSAKLVPTFADIECRVVSATDPHGR
jgi:hypothetical protein